MEQKHTCANCGGRIAYPSEAAGATVACPHCTAEIVLGSSPAPCQTVVSAPLPKTHSNASAQNSGRDLVKARTSQNNKFLTAIGLAVIVAIVATTALVVGLRSSASRKSKNTPPAVPVAIPTPQVQLLPVNGSLFYVTTEQQNIQLGNVGVTVFNEEAWKRAIDEINKLVLASNEIALQLKPMFQNSEEMAHTVLKSKNSSMSAAYNVFLGTKEPASVRLAFIKSNLTSEEIYKPFEAESELMHKCWSMLIDINQKSFSSPGTLTLQKPLLDKFSIIASNMTVFGNEKYLHILGTDLQGECRKFFNDGNLKNTMSARDHLFMFNWTKNSLVGHYQQCFRQHAAATNNLQEWVAIHKVSQTLSDSTRSIMNLDEIFRGYLNALSNAQDGVEKATTDAMGKFSLRLASGKTYRAIARVCDEFVTTAGGHAASWV